MGNVLYVLDHFLMLVFELKYLGIGVFALVVLMLLTLALSQIPMANANAGPLTLEKSQEWYLIETACIPYGQNVFVEDVDGDGVKEIIAGGLSSDGTRFNAMLTIWNWSKMVFALEKSRYWHTLDRTVVMSIYVSDVDGDGVKEIITGGSTFEGTRSYAQLRFWTWDGTALALENSLEWNSMNNTRINCLFVEDVDGDGVKEVVTGGETHDDMRSHAQLRIWKWDGSALTLERSKEWYSVKDAVVMSIYVSDVDGDGVKEIITGGGAHDGSRDNGQIRIWNWDGSTLMLEGSKEWYTAEGTLVSVLGKELRSTAVSTVKVDDVDGDGLKEVVTGGCTYDGALLDGQLRIWNWNGSALKLEASEEWCTGNSTEIKSVSIDDVDGDGLKEIITSGYAHDGVRFNGQLSIWRWDGATSTLEESEEWCVEEGTASWCVDVDDVDYDGVKEIITGGCIYIGVRCNAQLRIWSFPDLASPSITKIAPANRSTVNTSTPTIRADYSDDYSGIDLAMVTVRVDDIDVTEVATITAKSVSYTPATPLSTGSHAVTVDVKDRSGNSAHESWTINVPSPLTPAYELYIAAAVAAFAILCVSTYLYIRRKK